MIAVVDYHTGNLHNVARALRRLGAACEVTAERSRLLTADAVILPGVGSAGYAMSQLRESGLAPVLGQVRRPLLGICLGLQLLHDSTAEEGESCLGLVGGRVVRFSSPGMKVPHVGWNQVSVGNAGRRLFESIPDRTYFYFVHSYFAPVASGVTIAECRYGPVDFAAAVQVDNYWGVQFHPELSGELGLRLLQNFVEISRCWS